MKRIKQILSNFHIRIIFKALIATLLLSFLYNLVYLFAGFGITDPRLFYAVQVVLSLASSLGFYKICTMVWTPDKEKMSFDVVLRVLILQGGWILLISAVIASLAALASSNMVASVFVQLISVVVLIGLIPFQLVYYYSLFLGKKSGKEIFGYIKTVFAAHYRSILNVYCALLLVVMAIDTFSGGPFSLAQGFYVPQILQNVLYVGNPMFSWMYVLFLSTSFGVSLSSMFVIIFFLFLIGFLYAYLDLNLVAYIQKECINVRTRKPKTHR